MKNPYPNEKFSKAVYSMATSPKPLRERIADAYIFNISHVKIEEVPETVRSKFSNLIERLTSVEPTANEGSVIASVQQMSTEEAIEIANDILYIADIIASEYHDN